MKSVIQEASSLIKAIEKGWEKAGKPREFTVRILEEAQRNFLGLTTKQAKVGIFFTETGSKQEQPERAERPQHPRQYRRPRPQQRPQQERPVEQGQERQFAQEERQYPQDQQRRRYHRRRRYHNRDRQQQSNNPAADQDNEE